MMRDADFGIVRARAFGTYDFKIVDPKLFLKEVAGSDQNFRLDEFADTMRSRIVSVFSDALASAQVPVLDVATRYSELGEALLPLINPVVGAKYGLQIASFIVENVSVPPEVEAAIDKRSSMAAVGNLNEFVKYQMAKGMEQPGGGGAAGTASELAVGFAIAQQLMQQGGVVAPATAPAGAMGTLALRRPRPPRRSGHRGTTRPAVARGRREGARRLDGRRDGDHHVGRAGREEDRRELSDQARGAAGVHRQMRAEG